MAGLEIIGGAIFVIIGLLLTYFIILLIALFDAIRDENILGLIILLIFPFFGLIIYLLFLNKPSGRGGNRK